MAAVPDTEQTLQLDDYILHHIQDSQEWQIPFLPPIALPDFLSLHGLMVIISSVMLIVLFGLCYQHRQMIPHGWTNLLETMVLFVRDQIAVATLGYEDGIYLTPFFCTQFFLILLLNLMGMLPIFAAATANINVAGGMALATLTMIIFVAIRRNGMNGFLKAFMPSGVPVAILLILTPIEVISLFLKSFALMLRLFVNMFVGHIIILSILGIVITIGYAAALPAILLAVGIMVLKVVVAFLQAYIFTFLSALFTSMVIQPDH